MTALRSGVAFPLHWIGTIIWWGGGVWDLITIYVWLFSIFGWWTIIVASLLLPLTVTIAPIVAIFWQPT